MSSMEKECGIDGVGEMAFVAVDGAGGADAEEDMMGVDRGGWEVMNGLRGLYRRRIGCTRRRRVVLGRSSFDGSWGADGTRGQSGFVVVEYKDVVLQGQ